jgi:hypothetical protein
MTYIPPPADAVDFELVQFVPAESDDVDFRLTDSETVTGAFTSTSAFTSDTSGSAQATFDISATFQSDTSGSAQATFSASVSYTSDTAGSAQAVFSTDLTFGAGRVLDVTSQPVEPSIAFTSDTAGSAQANFSPVTTYTSDTAGSAQANFSPTYTATGILTVGTQDTGGVYLPQTVLGGRPIFIGQLDLVFDATTDVVSAEASGFAPVVWRVIESEENVVDNVYDIEVVDTANPFGSYAVVYADDDDGVLFDTFNRGTRIDISYSINAGITFEDRFTGYVVETREYDDAGADAVEIEAYTFDQFLRRNNVSEDQSGKTITQALSNIIQNDTPIEYDSARVDVQENTDLSRSFKGESVEEALRDIAFKSANEAFGVDDDGVFFFAPREGEVNERGIDNTQWFNYDIPEVGKDAVNEVTVFYNDDNDAVIVDDGTDQLELQDSLGFESPGTQRVEVSRPDITTIEDAEDVGRQILNVRNNTLTGEVTTFGLYDAQPGDTINIEIEPRGIDDEFVIAEIAYRWSTDETVIVIVEKTGDEDDIINRISESVRRVETRNADRDAIADRIFKVQTDVVIEPTVTIDGTTFETARVTNDGLNAIRDGWKGEGNIDMSFIKLGDDGGNLSRANTDLNNEIASKTPTESLPTGDTVEYENTFTESGVEEVGLFDIDDTLIARAVFDPVDVDGDVTFGLKVRNCDGNDRSIIVDQGKETVRDIIADNSPSLPQAYAFGTSNDNLDTSNDSLGNEVAEQDFEDVRVALIGAPTSWDNDVTFSEPALKRIAPTIGGVEVVKRATLVEAEDAEDFPEDGRIVGGQINPDNDASQETEVVLTGDPAFVEFDFTPEYDMDPDDVVIAARRTIGTLAQSFNGDEEFTFEQDTFDIRTRSNFIVDQHEWLVSDPVSNSANAPATLTAGTPYTVSYGPDNITSSGLSVDAIWVGDKETYQTTFQDAEASVPNFTYDRDGTTVTVDRLVELPGEYPQGPLEIDVDTINTAQSYTSVEVDISSSFEGVLRPNDEQYFSQTDQFIRVSNGTDPDQQVDNVLQATFDFSTPSTTLDITIGLGSYSDDLTIAPLQEQKGMTIRQIEASIGFNPVKVSGIGQTTTRVADATAFAVGDVIREGGHKRDTGSGDLLTRSIAYPDVEFDATFRVSSDDRVRFKNPEPTNTNV